MASSSHKNPTRYFTNPYKDYDGKSDVGRNANLIRDRLNGILTAIESKQRRSLANCDGGVYVGLSGIAFAYYRLSTLPELSEKKTEYLKMAAELIGISLEYCESEEMKSDPAMIAGFLLGNVGVYSVAALINQALGLYESTQIILHKISEASKVCVPINFLRKGSDEMFVGRAGYLYSCIILRKYLNTEIISQETITSLCNLIIRSGREYSRHYQLNVPLMYAYYRTEYLGAAHGLSGILQALLCFPEFLKNNPDAENSVRKSVDSLMELQTPNGNFPCAMDEIGNQRPESEDLVHWCHGAPGVVYCLARAYLYWKDPKYMESCIRCGELIWVKGLLRKGPGICHGIAGNGYVFLMLYRLTGEKKYLYRANRFADFMFSKDFQQHAHTPDSPYSLFEGLAGTACFLGDLLHPEQAEFPLFNIFVDS